MTAATRPAPASGSWGSMWVRVGDLILRNSSVTHCQAYAGNGGAGGDGGMGPLFHGVGGAGGIGGDAAGVAISFAGNAPHSTQLDSRRRRGRSGDGAASGTGDSTYTLYPGGAGGDGGIAQADWSMQTAPVASSLRRSRTVTCMQAAPARRFRCHARRRRDARPAAGAAFLGDQTDFGFVDYVALSTAVAAAVPHRYVRSGRCGRLDQPRRERELPGKRAGNPGTSVSSVRFGQPLPAYHARLSRQGRRRSSVVQRLTA